MMGQKASREISEIEKNSSGFSNFLHLFDELWFFHNALNGDLVNIEKMASPSAACQLIIRTPSLPPPRVRCEGEEEPAPRNYSSGRKLTYSYSSMDAPPLQQSISSFSSSKSTGKQRAPRTEAAPHRRCAYPHLLMRWEASNRRNAFQNKKWRSLGDLETMELQGFKDLGFVFDEREEGLSSRRLYLPEGWFAQSSMVLRRVGCSCSCSCSCRSREEMKKQLRFWARAVACNVRLDC